MPALCTKKQLKEFLKKEQEKTSSPTPKVLQRVVDKYVEYISTVEFGDTFHRDKGGMYLYFNLREALWCPSFALRDALRKHYRAHVFIEKDRYVLFVSWA